MRSAVEPQHTEPGFSDYKSSPFPGFFEAEGFPVSGAVSWPSIREEYREHAERYRVWIQNRKQGEMQYLERGLERRLDPTKVFPDLKSVFAVLRPYSPHPVGDESLRYARYLNGPDYHDEIPAGLERALQRMKGEGVVPPGFEYKICVDTSAVLERTWGALCGLGWIGKNTLLLHPQLGSYTFLGVVFTNLTTAFRPERMKDYCGPCTRCLQACPTEALASHELDSRRCISYLTLEKRGPWEETLPTKGYLAGCDLCQEACPYNTKPVRYTEPVATAPHLVLEREKLEGETEEDYRDRIRGTALSRVRYSESRRNLAATRSAPRK